MIGTQLNKQQRLFRRAAQIVNQKNARLHGAVADHQRADVVILGDKHPAISERLLQKSRVSWIGGSFRRIHNIVPGYAERTYGRRCDIGVRKEAHA